MAPQRRGTETKNDKSSNKALLKRSALCESGLRSQFAAQTLPHLYNVITFLLCSDRVRY